MADDDKIQTRTDGPIGWVIFNDPARHNAMSLSMWRRTHEVLQAYADDPAIRVVLLTGAGGKAFISGANMDEFATERNNPDAIARYDFVADACKQFLYELDKPTIALVRGWCLGGGLGVAACCDLRIAADGARFGVPAAKLSAAYPIIDLKRLADLVGPARLLEIFYTAKNYTAAEAAAFGLVNHVLAEAELDKFAEDMAQGIAANAPLSHRATKRTLHELLKYAGEQDLARCIEPIAQCFASADNAEGQRAFREKRKPVFTGK